MFDIECAVLFLLKCHDVVISAYVEVLFVSFHSFFMFGSQCGSVDCYCFICELCKRCLLGISICENMCVCVACVVRS